MLGTIGHAGAFSFNYKNITAGEGGAVCTADDALAERVKCAIDPCHFYWQAAAIGRSRSPATARGRPRSWAPCSTSSSTACPA